ncbi:MAG: hypothetical protein V1750_06050 [Acidobacteriota bacterium]
MVLAPLQGGPAPQHRDPREEANPPLAVERPGAPDHTRRRHPAPCGERLPRRHRIRPAGRRAFLQQPHGEVRKAWLRPVARSR